MKIKLNYNYGYKWYSKNGIYVKGYCFDEDNNLWSEDNFINYFLNVNNEVGFKQKLIKANGIFSVIIKKENIILFATDRTRTFPIFYTIEDDELYISDDTYYLRDKFKNKIDDLSSKEYLATGYVTGKETLLENIFQVQAGEYIVSQNQKIFTNSYFTYVTTHVFENNYEELEKQFIAILDKMIGRLIEYANGKQIVLPLSGGYDSRLIACMLKKYNYKNILCFTYGSVDSYEVSISKKVAQELGYKWIFIEYNRKTIHSNFVKEEEFINYAKYASNYSSKMGMQDYFAIKHLTKNNLLERNAIIVPGHSGDFLGGSHFHNNPKNKTDIIDTILKNHYILNQIKFNSIKDRFKNNLNIENIDKDYFYSIVDNWNMKERQSKFIINSDRIYEYFGYKHYLPLWDLELVEFFKKISLEYKRESYFYKKVLFDNIFKNFNVDYRQPKIKKSILKDLIRPFIPNFIRQYRSKKLFNNKNNIDLFSKPILEDLNENIHFSKSNTIIVKWYISKISEYKYNENNW